MSTRFHHVLPFGAEPQPGGGVRFRLWAPAETAVSLVIEDTEAAVELAMTRDGAGWFELVTDRARAGSLSRYRLSDDLPVPAPAPRFQPRAGHGPSEVIDPSRYAWRNPEWSGRPWEETVLYEAHVGTFSA